MSPPIYVSCITRYFRGMSGEIIVVDGTAFHLLPGPIDRGRESTEAIVRKKIKELLTTKTKLTKHPRKGQGCWVAY